MKEKKKKTANISKNFFNKNFFSENFEILSESMDKIVETEDEYNYSDEEEEEKKK